MGAVPVQWPRVLLLGPNATIAVFEKFSVHPLHRIWVLATSITGCRPRQLLPQGKAIRVQLPFPRPHHDGIRCFIRTQVVQD